MKSRFCSLDRHLKATCDYLAPDRFADLMAVPAKPGLIPRGSGLSYVAASFGEGGTSVGLGAFDRILGLDPVARTMEVEAGITLGKLYDVLTPRGLCLAVQPGYPAITVGGCIAGNVHGKNHVREGVFGRHVLSLRLLHPRHGLIEASPDENAEVFDLTIGGLGLTGVILSARLRLAPLAGGMVEKTHHAVDSLEEAFREVGQLRDQTDMLYAWLDLASPSRPLGRGYVTAASMKEGVGADIGKGRGPSLDPQRRDIRRQPIFNHATIPWINRLYRWNALRAPDPSPVPLYNFLFPAIGLETYFHFFGKAGLIEQQVLLPAAAVDSYIPEFRRVFSRHRVPSILTTLKAFGGGRQHALHYDGEGFSFTIDVASSPAALALLAELDEVNTHHGGITAVLKDSRLSADVAQRQYPGLEPFRERLHGFDPQRLFTSALSERLKL